MNRQEAIERIQELVATKEINKCLEILRQPITLSEFLGWEEDVEYEWNDYRYKISEGSILYCSLFSNKYEMFCDKDLSKLREAKKVREKRFNLILQKGYRELFDLQDCEKYLTIDTTDGTVFNSKYSSNNSKYQAQFTLEEIEEIKKKYDIDLCIYEIVEVQE